MLKKNVSTSRRLPELKNDTCRLLYTWMIPHLDIKGRFSANPYIVKGSIVPRLKHITIKKIEDCLINMDERDVILLYKIDGDKYLQLRKFEKHQSLKPEREAKSEIPDPTPEQLRSKSRPIQTQDKIREDKRREDKKEIKVFHTFKDLKKFRGSLFDDNGLIIFEHFYKLGFKCEKNKEKDLAKWFNELSDEFEDISFKEEIKKFYLWYEESNKKLKNHKLAWRNWLSNARKYKEKNEQN